jgi:hypothetical protein
MWYRPVVVGVAADRPVHVLEAAVRGVADKSTTITADVVETARSTLVSPMKSRPRHPRQTGFSSDLFKC